MTYGFPLLYTLFWLRSNLSIHLSINLTNSTLPIIIITIYLEIIIFKSYFNASNDSQQIISGDSKDNVICRNSIVNEGIFWFELHMHISNITDSDYEEAHKNFLLYYQIDLFFLYLCLS